MKRNKNKLSQGLVFTSFDTIILIALTTTAIILSTISFDKSNDIKNNYTTNTIVNETEIISNTTTNEIIFIKYNFTSTFINASNINFTLNFVSDNLTITYFTFNALNFTCPNNSTIMNTLTSTDSIPLYLIPNNELNYVTTGKYLTKTNKQSNEYAGFFEIDDEGYIHLGINLFNNTILWNSDTTQNCSISAASGTYLLNPM